VRTLISIALAWFVAGCRCPDPERLFRSEFEDCADACGYDVLAGTVRRISTVHPGEHALELSPSAVIEQQLAVAAVDLGSVEWVTRGSSRAELRDDGEQLSIVITLQCGVPGEYQRATWEIPENDPCAAQSDSGGMDETADAAACDRELVLRIENGTSACPIDAVRMFAPTPYCP
jgi:hypothetical protein